MFTITPNVTDLKVKERNIFKMLYSMNSPQVATPELSVEEARCYVLFFSEGPNLSAYIGLYLSRIGRKIFYSYTSNPFPFEAAPDVEFEATGFAEDMGFLLDEISVSGMPVDDRNRWIEEQYIFGYKKPDLEEEAVTAAAAEKDISAPVEKEEVHAEEAKTGPPAIAAHEKPVEPLPSLNTGPAQKVEPVQLQVQPQTQSQPQPQPQTQHQAAPVQQQSPIQQQPQVQPPQPTYPPYQQQVPQQGQTFPPLQPNNIQQQQPQALPTQQPYGQPQQPYGQPQQPYGQPQQPYGQTQPPYNQPQQYQQPFPHQGQPMMPQYPAAPPQLPPAFEQRAAPPKKAQPTQQAKAPLKKKVQKAPQPVPDVSYEETAPPELEREPAQQRPANVFEEALRQGVVKPPRAKPAKTNRPAGSVVARDKEALARLLASF